MKKTVEELLLLSKNKKLRDLEWTKCYNDPYYWLTTWAFTLDTHDEENPVKPFPEKEYIEFVVDKWLKHKMLFVPKTRQMMISWLFVALYLWEAQFHFGKAIAFQSKKADDADYLIRRAYFIWSHQPKFLRRYYEKGEFKPLRCNPTNQGNPRYGLIEFPDRESSIIGVPEGADVVRSLTLSGLLSDESGFQPEMEEAYTALKPTLSSGGRLTCVSTAEDNTWFEEAVFDKLEM